MARKTKNTSDFWAFVTIAAFPLALLVTQAMGFGHEASFGWGMAASLAALSSNAMTDNRLWMFDPRWKTRFDRPDFSFRLTVVTGAILLLVESLVLVSLFAGNFDRNALALVYQRQCRVTNTENAEFCGMLDRVLAQRAP